LESFLGREGPVSHRNSAILSSAETLQMVRFSDRHSSPSSIFGCQTISVMANSRRQPISKSRLPPMSDVTRILSRIDSGDPAAADQLLPLVYEELRKLAVGRLALETPGQTLQATALVHEAYLRLVESDRAQPWNSRGHFFAAAAEAMRRILVEKARYKQREKRGGCLERVEFPTEGVPDTPHDGQLLLLDEALNRLASVRPQAAKLVKLRFFAGLPMGEAADNIGLSERTARRLWVFAQAWLRREVESLDDRKPMPDR
jgi:RNA polymerase sigma factor (TIGR02999 family)